MLEELLKNLSADLWIAEKTIIEKQCPKLRKPLILLMGPMRSGTTLFMQWLAKTELFAYPTNLLSRFYQAPIIGAKIQVLLTDPKFNYRDELVEFMQKTDYCSDNGKTKGVLAPNEFWYFWRRFLIDPSQDVWTNSELQLTMDVPTMKAELAGLMDVFQKPFAAKGLLFNYNIPFLDKVLDKALFIQINRDPTANVASVLEARRRQLGSENVWYSFRIPEYDELKGLDAVSQCAGQVHYINKAVDRGISAVDESRKLVVQYEEFCANPKGVFEQLTQKLGMRNSDYIGPDHFVPTRTSALANKGEIDSALSQF